jgi:hypothetical protein
MIRINDIFFFEKKNNKWFAVNTNVEKELEIKNEKLIRSLDIANDGIIDETSISIVLATLINLVENIKFKEF